MNALPSVGVAPFERPGVSYDRIHTEPATRVGVANILASDDPRIRIDTLRSVLGDEHTVCSADLSSTERVVETVREADALVVDTGVPVPAAVFDACEDLDVVARAGTGVDNIDIAAADDAGVTVTNVPEYCTEEVSTHAVSLFLTLFRHVESYDRAIEDGRWDWTDGRPIRRLSEQTVGFHSFGGIARRTAEKLAGFGCELIASDPYVDADEMAAHGVEKVSFGELLETADHVSVHAPLTEETHHSFDRSAFERMRETAILVNVGRGPIVDQPALRRALDAGEIAAAGLDVLNEEPPVDSELVGRDDVVVTPHAAFYSEDSLVSLNEHVAGDVRDALAGDRPDGFVDPNAAVP